jgi:hypothetical protein
MGGVTFDLSISVDGYTSSASPRTPIARSETATFANGWLTEMIKARLHSQQSGPDEEFRCSGDRI